MGTDHAIKHIPMLSCKKGTILRNNVYRGSTRSNWKHGLNRLSRLKLLSKVPLFDLFALLYFFVYFFFSFFYYYFFTWNLLKTFRCKNSASLFAFGNIIIIFSFFFFTVSFPLEAISGHSLCHVLWSDRRSMIHSASGIYNMDSIIWKLRYFFF